MSQDEINELRQLSRNWKQHAEMCEERIKHLEFCNARWAEQAKDCEAKIQQLCKAIELALAESEPLPYFDGCKISRESAERLLELIK